MRLNQRCDGWTLDEMLKYVCTLYVQKSMEVMDSVCLDFYEYLFVDSERSIVFW